jgi:hypothetical protein
MKTPILFLGLAFGLTAGLPAQAGQEAPAPDQWTSQVFASWQLENPGFWILRERDDVRAAAFLYGAKLAPKFTPQTDADFADLALEGLARTADLFRIDADTLVLEEIKFLEMSLGGGSDKIAVIFQQVQDNLPVIGAGMYFLFNPQGELLAVDSGAFPGVEELNTSPLLTSNDATRAAQAAFVEYEGRAAQSLSKPELVIYPTDMGKLSEARLAWSVELRAEGDGIPSGRRIYVAADNFAKEVLGDDQLVHECGFDHGDHAPVDLQGSVESWATPGTKPDTGSNPEVLMPMRYMLITGAAGSTYSDANGDFVLPYGGTTDVDLTFAYTGTWCRVYNQAGASYSFTQTFTPGVADTATLNASKTENDTAHANAYRSVNDFHEWIKEIDPSDNHFDFEMRANVNLNSDCNAYYNGNSINFYTSGSGCVNTAFTTVVAHEEGHWANDLYGSGNGGDGFGEGAADVWAMYLYDTPLVGEDFCGPGCGIRSGWNNRQFCGDSNGGCYGQVHNDGEVLMGALWKVRDNLNTSLGNAAGDLYSDTILLAWFNGYNDRQIKTIIEDHWLALDDDDGNVGNGTPNFDEINDGFLAQGFPGVELDYIQIDHVALVDTQNETNPYMINATMAPLWGNAVTAATVHYSVDGGAEQTQAMSETLPGEWSAGIPAQASPSTVTYWITALDDIGNNDRFPKRSEIEFLVGLRRIIFFTNFDTVSDEGWVHEYGGGTSNSHDDWQHDSPKGKGGDPAAAYSGTKIWGNDIGNSGWNGLYQANVNIRLKSPLIDCTGKSGVRLRFARWLSVEEGIYDKASVQAAGSLVWDNAANSDHIDNAWTMVDYDVSAFVDNVPDVELRWILKSDAGLEYGGWNIDDVMLYTLEQSGATDTIFLSGDLNPLAGTSAHYDFFNGPKNGTYYGVYSLGNSGTVFNGHQFDIGPGYTIALSGAIDADGNAGFDLPIPPPASGLTAYLEIAGVDAEKALTDSNVLTVVVQ